MVLPFGQPGKGNKREVDFRLNLVSADEPLGWAQAVLPSEP